MVAVDSNVLAYLFLSGPQTAYARALLAQDPDWHSESFVLIEMTNVLATTMRARGLSLRDASIALVNAQQVIEPGLHVASHTEVLELAAKIKVSGYDARFLIVARELGVRLVTEDQRLRRAAPTLTQTIAEALAA